MHNASIAWYDWSVETETRANMSDREAAMPRGIVRKKTPEQWIEDHGPGTLRKAKRLEYVWRPMYLEDRTAYEWGWGFKMIPRSRVTFGDAIIEGDEPSMTETCWHQERYFTLNPFPDSDRFEAKYIYIERSGELKLEGAGIILRSTSALWVPSGHIVCSIIAEYDTVKHRWKKARNPT